MLNEKRVITMSKMAMYNTGKKKQCMKVTSYYKKDYIVFQTIMALLWWTLGYCIIVAGLLFMQIDMLLTELSFELIEELLIYIAIGYGMTLVIFGVISAIFYEWKYSKSIKVAKKYYQALGALNAEYKREK